MSIVQSLSLNPNSYALTDLPILLNIREQTWLIAQAPSFTLVILLMWEELRSIKVKSHNIG
jgi:hypothetical protein